VFFEGFGVFEQEPANFGGGEGWVNGTVWDPTAPARGSLTAVIDDPDTVLLEQFGDVVCELVIVPFR
jgi:hypothetical protein